MKKFMLAMLLTLTLCLSACTKIPQTNTTAKSAQSETGQTAPTPAPTTPENESDDKSDMAHHESASVTPEKEEPAAVFQKETAEEQTVDRPPLNAFGDTGTEPSDAMELHPAVEESADDTESEATAADSSVTELSKEDILVDFQGRLVKADTPIRVYSPMFTRTEDSYYAIAPDTVFTVTNNGTNKDAYLVVSMVEWIRSEESFFSVVNHNGEYLELDMFGEYWNDDQSLWLSSQMSTALPAGDDLCWGETDSEGNRPQQTIKLFPGESVTFRLPEREQDAICFLVARYQNDTEEFGLPSRSLFVTADDVRTPSTMDVP